MPIAPDPLFGIHPQALSVFSRRAEVIAGNLANADTPHYLARDVDFRALLARAGSPEASLPLATSANGHVSGHSRADGGAGLAYRTPSQPALDGNTVDTQTEQAAYAENGVRYQASLTFLNAQVRMLRLAISGAG